MDRPAHTKSAKYFILGVQTFCPEIARPTGLAELRVRYGNSLVKKLGIDNTEHSGLQPARHRNIIRIYSPARLSQLAFQGESMAWPSGERQRQHWERLMSHECIHINAIRNVIPSALGCEECLKIGSPWVHLRSMPDLWACRLLRRFCRTATPRSTSTRPAIRSSKAMTHPKAGDVLRGRDHARPQRSRHAAKRSHPSVLLKSAAPVAFVALVEPSPERLIPVLHRWRDEAIRAGRTITRIALAFEAGRDGFWLARWLVKLCLTERVPVASLILRGFGAFGAEFGSRRSALPR